METIDYSWCYINLSSNNRSKEEDDVVYNDCNMCDEHYIHCTQDCMIDFD